MIAEDDSQHGLVTVVAPAEDLTFTERKIIATWFDGEPVRADPHNSTLSNGRHRLWATLPYFGTAQVPVHSSSLEYANPEDAETLGSDWSKDFADGLAKTRNVAWFDTGDRLNQRYLAAYSAATNGQFPEPA